MSASAGNPRAVRISVVIPCHNGAEFLTEALDSVAAQTRAPDEVVVVDDASTDGSAALARAWGATVVRLEAHRGEGAARNAGLRAAAHPFVAWLDADDRWRPRHLEVVGGLLASSPDAVAAFGGAVRFGGRAGAVPGYVPPGPPVRLLETAFSTWLQTTITCVLRRDPVLALGGFAEDEQASVDFDLWLRLAAEHSFVATDEVTAEWRAHAGQQSAHLGAQLAATYRFRRRFLDSRRATDPELVRRLEARLVQVWRRDVSRAALAGEREVARQVLAAAPLVPKLRLRDRIVWPVLTRTPPQLAAAVLRARPGALAGAQPVRRGARTDARTDE